MSPRLPRSRVGHDRWLISYADFITLLFAFFVVLFAFARADRNRQVQVSKAIDSAFRSMGGSTQAARPSRGEPVAGMQSASADSVAVEDIVASGRIKDDLDRLRRDLMSTLSSQVASHAISLEMGRDGLVISLREAGFFDSGSAVPKPEALPTLRTIAAKLGTEHYDVRVEGHTDDVPIHTAEFDSNWELSSARATRIARLFLEMKAMSPDRLSAAGYAEFHPVASNETAQGRSENRRVDLVVMPRSKIDFAGTGGVPANSDWRRVVDK